MTKVIVILGPTASGKTKISIELAKKIQGEIISADSMQIYKYMDIGTAKPTIEEMQGIKHYLIDEMLPNEEFSVASYRDLALKYIDEISKENKIPIIVGGTGLYINSLIYNIEFSETVINWEFRNKLQNEALENGNEYIYERLKNIDPSYSNKIHLNDTKRIIRALEVYEFTKKTMSYHIEKSRGKVSSNEFILIGLNLDRELLYDRINKRVDIMIENGLVDEVKKLIAMGYDKNIISMQAIGYKEILSYLNNDVSLDEAIEKIKQGSRRYAKRQLTWFRRIENVHWIYVDKTREIFQDIKKYLECNGIFL